MKRFTCLTALFIALVLFAPTSPLGSEEPEDVTLNGQVQECKKNGKGLSVLFLVDHSSSLKNTDPDKVRVDAINATVVSLREKTDIFVAFLQFGSYPRQVVADSSTRNDLWHKLSLSDASISDVSSIIEGLKKDDWHGDTDYLGALRPASLPFTPDYRKFREKIGISPIGAIEALNRAPQNTCKLIIWFSDGQHDIEDKPVGQREFFWDRQTTIIEKTETKTAEEVAIEITEQTKARLCEPGGLVDELRGHGRSMNDGRTFVATVGLGNKDFGLLTRMAEGKDEKGQTCGNKINPAVGQFFPAHGPFGLVHALEVAVDSDKRSNCGAPGQELCAREQKFPVHWSWSKFTLGITTAKEGTVPILVSPNKTEYPFPSVAGEILRKGLIETEFRGSGIYGVSAEAPQTIEDWAGIWTVDFGVEDPLARITYGFAGDIKPQLQEGHSFRQGKTGHLTFKFETDRIEEVPFDEDRLRFDMVNVSLSGDRWGTRNGLVISGKSPLAGADGNPRDVSCEVAYLVSYKIGEKDFVKLSNGTEKCGTITVKPVASYPTIHPDVLELGELNSDASVEAVSKVMADRQDEEGCVTFEDQDTEALQKKGLKLVLQKSDGEEIEVGGEICIPDAPDSKKFHLEVSIVDSTKLGGPEGYPLEGTLTFRTRSAIDEKTSEELTVRFSMTVDPPTTSHTPWLEVILWVLGSLALPAVFLYLYNFLRGSRFSKTGPLLVADVPIRFTSQGIAPALGRTDVVSNQDLVTHAGIAAPTRSFKVTVDNTTVAVFQGRVPLWPHVSPHASVSRPDTPQAAVFSELGGDSDLSSGRLRPSLTYAWVVSINPPDPSTVENNAELVGRLVLITPVVPQDTGTAPAADLNHVINEQFDLLGDDIRKWEQRVATDEARTSSETGSQSPNQDLSAIDNLPDDERPTRQIGDLPDDSLGPDIDLPELPD